MTFVDTSALLALLDADDRCHAAARATLELLRRDRAELVTSSYVVHECVSLVQRRLGMPSVRQLTDGLLAVIEIHWVDEVLHERALAAMLAANQRAVSLTDWSSFEVMRARGLALAFAFDPGFAHQGFTVLPATGV